MTVASLDTAAFHYSVHIATDGINLGFNDAEYCIKPGQSQTV